MIRRQATTPRNRKYSTFAFLFADRDGLVNNGLIAISKSLEPFLSEGRARAGVSSSMHAAAVIYSSRVRVR